MVKNSKQTWSVGSIVKVGFLSLEVMFAVPTPGDSKPDAYILRGIKPGSVKIFKFVPYFGLEAITAEEAWFIVEQGKKATASIADKAIASAAASAALSIWFKQLQGA